ncbi:hypothetical protein [Mycobacteroides abscessus]|uniref:hypothetical protein n=1 Tax=Mycobacteroides abscessus TaxID=36809 RepID=UPI000927FB1F|nr:hypothetical protein [Mycobacteroides abscessus]SIA21989.1 Uncharacterised protein [Mycobacteroides abscessus subsp. abscessus]SKT81853.1 Uncharacterised protein [Mycobacteroides abscessus subsp. massiliense]SKT98406.1 Uncharacterised protein [Mycobacteroides abscessus subsp. massiliense]
MTNPTETVTIAVLLGFNSPPPLDADAQELYSKSEAATFALKSDDLPHGGWTEQGFAFERVVEITVPVDSPEAQSAIVNIRP